MEIKVAKNQPTNGFVAYVPINGKNRRMFFDGFTAIYGSGYGFSMEAVNPANGGIASALKPAIDDDW